MLTLPRPSAVAQGAVAGQVGSKHIPLFLKRDEGLGEGKNLFSREKKFFPSPQIFHAEVSGLELRKRAEIRNIAAAHTAKLLNTLHNTIPLLRR